MAATVGGYGTPDAQVHTRARPRADSCTARMHTRTRRHVPHTHARQHTNTRRCCAETHACTGLTYDTRVHALGMHTHPQTNQHTYTGLTSTVHACAHAPTHTYTREHCTQCTWVRTHGSQQPRVPQGRAPGWDAAQPQPRSCQTPSLLIASEALTQSWGEGKKRRSPLTSRGAPVAGAWGPMRPQHSRTRSLSPFWAPGRQRCGDLGPCRAARPRERAMPSPSGPRSGTRQTGDLIRRWNNAAVIE